MQYSFYIKYNTTRAFKVSWKLLYDGWWEKSIYNELIVKTYKWELSLDLLWYIWLQAGVNQIRSLFVKNFIKSSKFPLLPTQLKRVEI